LVSVLIASYNYEQFIGRTIESVLHQSYSNVEVVVCDDGSSDESAEVVERLARKDPRVTLIRQQNAGHTIAYNAAYRRSRGEILCILDADDLFAPHKVEAIVRCFQEHRDVGYVIHPLIMVDSDDRHIQPLTLLDSFEEGFIADR